MYETTYIPLQNEGFHPTMGLVVATHPDMKDAVELVQLQIGTKAHTRIRNWKCRLRGTIITSLDDQPIKCRQDIIKAIRKARQQHKKNIRIKFGSLTGFSMSGEGVPTLQANQLNVIAHHLYNINNKQDLWIDKEELTVPIDYPKSITE